MNKKQLAAEILAETVRDFIRCVPSSDPRNCPADISAEPCICGWHTAYDAMKKAEFIYRMADFSERVVIGEPGHKTRVVYTKTLEDARDEMLQQIRILRDIRGYTFLEIYENCWCSDILNGLAFVEIKPNDLDAIHLQICESM